MSEIENPWDYDDATSEEILRWLSEKESPFFDMPPHMYGIALCHFLSELADNPNKANKDALKLAAHISDKLTDVMRKSDL